MKMKVCCPSSITGSDPFARIRLRSWDAVAVAEQERPGDEHHERARRAGHAGAPGLVGAHLLAPMGEAHRVAAHAVLALHLHGVADSREVVGAVLPQLGEQALELA